MGTNDSEVSGAVQVGVGWRGESGKEGWWAQTLESRPEVVCCDLSVWRLPVDAQNLGQCLVHAGFQWMVVE